VELPGRGTTFVRELPGPPGAPAVLLLHGWTVTADLNWFRCYRPLAANYRVVALDLRGHGRGIRSGRRFSLADCADDAAAAARVLGLGGVVAVGYSMGGPVALLLWRRHPELVQGLVLCATGARLVRHDLGSQVLAANLAALSVAGRLAPSCWVRGLARGLAERKVEPGPLRDWMVSEILAGHPPSLLEAGVAVRTFDATAWAPEVDVPTAVVVTTADAVVSPRRQRRLAELVAEASVHEVDGDHGACVNQAAAFVPALEEALGSVCRRAASLAATP
jgi:3-oxoadipate enol-lactonase